jgi:hypothetical protein
MPIDINKLTIMHKTPFANKNKANDIAIAFDKEIAPPESKR